MSIMQIYFLVDPSGLTKDGTFDDPKPYGDCHPPIQYGYRGRSLTHANGDTPVPVRQGDNVNIYAIQAGGIVDGRPVIEPRLEIAPVRVIAMTWTPTGGDKQDASQALMTGGQAPIGELTFAMHDICTYGAKYTGCRQPLQRRLLILDTLPLVLRPTGATPRKPRRRRTAARRRGPRSSFSRRTSTAAECTRPDTRSSSP